MQLSDITPNLYPTHLLSECSSGLCLFGAGFYGRNDAIHMFDAGMTDVTVVDIDATKVKVMQEIYPSSWAFSASDVKEWISYSTLTYDIVSVDAPTNMFTWVLGNFDEIAKLANKYIVITMSSQLEEEYFYYLDHQDWYVKDTINRSVSGLVVLLTLARRTGASEAR